MKATGIVRRIDDLGRIVIPKEIRRTMRIREGDPLEIYTEIDGSVIFKKYSPMGESAAVAEQLAEAVSKTCGKTCIITDSDVIMAAGGPMRTQLEGKAIDAQLDAIILRRQNYFDCAKPVLATAAAPDILISIVVPVIAEGDLCGCVALACNDERCSEVDLSAVQTAANMFSRHLEG